jgi:hypothetical protein
MKLDFGQKSTLTLDFTSRVYVRDRTHTYLFLREKKDKGYFLTMDNGVIEVVKVPLEEGEFRVWKANEGEVEEKVARIYHKLTPVEYDPMKAIMVYWNSTLDKSVAADRELRLLLGMQVQDPGDSTPSNGAKRVTNPDRGISLADLCLELDLEGSQARKILRTQGVEKPGDRWEWTDPDQANSVKEILRANKPG